MSSSSREVDKRGKLILDTELELVGSEVTKTGKPSGKVPAETLKLSPARGPVAVEDMVSGSLWETLEVVWETLRPVSEGRVTTDTVGSGSRWDAVSVATADLASVSNWVAHEAVVSG